MPRKPAPGAPFRNAGNATVLRLSEVGKFAYANKRCYIYITKQTNTHSTMTTKKTAAFINTQIPAPSALRSNPAYQKMFSAVTGKPTEALKDAFILLDAMPASRVNSLTKAILFDEIELREGEELAGKFLDSITN